MIHPHDSDKYPRYARKYGLGENIREEYLEALSTCCLDIKPQNREELEIIDTLAEELGNSLGAEHPDEYFLDQVAELFELSANTNVRGEFVVDVGFAFENFGRMQLNGDKVRRTIELNGDKQGINGDEQSYGTLVKRVVLKGNV